MTKSYDLAKMFYDQFASKGKKNGSRISPKQADWLRNVYTKENPTWQYTRGKYLVVNHPLNAKIHFRLNGDNSLYCVEA